MTSMTKEQALVAMGEGKKVAHKYFTPDEWMKLNGSLYEFEDGVLCKHHEFWSTRDDASWSEGWRIWE